MIYAPEYIKIQKKKNLYHSATPNCTNEESGIFMPFTTNSLRSFSFLRLIIPYGHVLAVKTCLKPEKKREEL